MKPRCPRLYFGLKWNCCESEFGWRPRIVAKVKIPFSYESAILGYLTAGLPLP
jgi:hypothetical protein